MNKELTQINQAKTALTEARDLYEILDIRDKAMAISAYADAQGASDAANLAKEVQLRAERKAGEFLRDMPKHPAGRPPNNRSQDVTDLPPTLDDIGISKMQSSRWQLSSELPDEDFEQIIAKTKASDGELTSSAIQRAARKLRAERDKIEPPPLEGKYRVIYADPPWSYDNTGFDQSAASHYPTMTTQDICDMPVGKIADTPCALFLWATSPLLPEALQVMDTWGFEYRASRVWIKDKAPSIGWWVKTRHEMLLIGTKFGNAHPIEKMDSVIIAPVTSHSKKPEQVYRDIETMYAGNKIELFAREVRDGWKSWGNEVD